MQYYNTLHLTSKQSLFYKTQIAYNVTNTFPITRIFPFLQLTDNNQHSLCEYVHFMSRLSVERRVAAKFYVRQLYKISPLVELLVILRITITKRCHAPTRRDCKELQYGVFNNYYVQTRYILGQTKYYVPLNIQAIKEGGIVNIIVQLGCAILLGRGKNVMSM